MLWGLTVWPQPVRNSGKCYHSGGPVGGSQHIFCRILCWLSYRSYNEDHSHSMVSVGASEQEAEVCLAAIPTGTGKEHEPCAYLSSSLCPLSLPQCKLSGEREEGFAALAMGSFDTCNISPQYAPQDCLGCVVRPYIRNLKVRLLELMKIAFNFQHCLTGFTHSLESDRMR